MGNTHSNSTQNSNKLNPTLCKKDNISWSSKYYGMHIWLNVKNLIWFTSIIKQQKKIISANLNTQQMNE